MHQDPEHNDYDDDEYNFYPQYNDYGYPKEFTVNWAAWEEWLSDAIKDIVNEKDNVWVFGSNQNKKEVKKQKKQLSDKYFMFLGSNLYDEAVWKKKYFISSKIEMQYKQHISSHPGHILRQPNYYRSMFDILN